MSCVFFFPSQEISLERKTSRKEGTNHLTTIRILFHEFSILKESFVLVVGKEEKERKEVGKSGRKEGKRKEEGRKERVLMQELNQNPLI